MRQETEQTQTEGPSRTQGWTDRQRWRPPGKQQQRGETSLPRKGWWGPGGDREGVEESQRWEGKKETQMGSSEHGPPCPPPAGLTAKTTAGGGLAEGLGVLRAGGPTGSRGVSLTVQPPGRAWRCRAGLAAQAAATPIYTSAQPPGQQGAVSSALLENPLREGVGGGGLDCTTSGSRGREAGPGALWIWGSPWLGAEGNSKGQRWERSWVWRPLKSEGGVKGSLSSDVGVTGRGPSLRKSQAQSRCGPSGGNIVGVT